jgi:hypothetical protein
MEKELTGNQHKLDKNKNGKLDKQDFKMLRKEESIEEAKKCSECGKVHSGSCMEEETEQDTSDYKVDKSGRKHKARKIIFNKGEEEGMKEEKKTYKSFIEQHTLPLTEEQLDEIVSELQEVLSKDASAGEWIHDFVHSDNPKFAGKSKEKRKEMALGAYYAKKRNEEVELEEADNLALRGLVSTDPKKAGRFLSTQKGKENRAKKNVPELKADIKRSLGKHPKPNLPEEYMEEAIEDTLHPSGAALLKHIKPEHHNLYKPHLAKGTFNGSFKDRHDVLTAAHTAGHLKETTDYRNKYSYSTDRITGSGARHDIKKTATGIIATRRFSDNDHAEKPKDEPKRGRGRPKKDKFAEAVDFLIGLDEQTFDSLMEEGFDSFFEAFEHLNKE